jgi:hypothetical protein
MSQSFEAVYDGTSLRLSQPLELPVNTVVRVTIEPCRQPSGEKYSFLDVAMNANLQGPADWSQKLDEYLYGGKNPAE